MTFRIGYARLNQETDAFSPLPTTFDDFERFHFVEGAALHRATGLLGAEVPGLSRMAELSGFRQAMLRHRDIEPVPLMSAWALASGPMDRACYDHLRGRFVDHLKAAGHLDGLYLSLHGAARSKGDIAEPEEGYIEAVREVLGDIPLAVSYDLHGQMTPTKVEVPDIVTAYQTNPHRDFVRTGRKTGHFLAQLVKGNLQPTVRWRTLPMVLGGGLTIDFLNPIRPVFRRLKELEKHPKVLYCSLFTVHLWDDSPDLGWSVVVMTDGDEVLADRLADELAELAWDQRRHGLPPLLSPQEAIDDARRSRLARKTGAVFMIDTSDVVGAGAPGENTRLIKALIEDASDMLSYGAVRDAPVVEQCWGKEGQVVDVTVGGRFDAQASPPLELQGKVVQCRDDGQFGKAVLLDCGSLQLIVTQNAPYTLRPNFFTDFGLDLWKADIVIAKAFFHFRVFFAAYVRKVIGVRTQGATDLDAWKRIDFRHPVEPAVSLSDWRDVDRIRRGA